MRISMLTVSKYREILMPNLMKIPRLINCFSCPYVFTWQPYPKYIESFELFHLQLVLKTKPLPKHHNNPPISDSHYRERTASRNCTAKWLYTACELSATDSGYDRVGNGTRPLLVRLWITKHPQMRIEAFISPWKLPRRLFAWVTSSRDIPPFNS